MDVAILCPTSNGIAFVPAADIGGRPRYPYRCPACDTVVAVAAEHPGSLSVDDLLEFPFLLCGSTALLAEAGSSRCTVVTSSAPLPAEAPAPSDVSTEPNNGTWPVWRTLIAATGGRRRPGRPNAVVPIAA